MIFPLKPAIYKGFSMAMLNNQMVHLGYYEHFMGIHHLDSSINNQANPISKLCLIDDKNNILWGYSMGYTWMIMNAFDGILDGIYLDMIGYTGEKKQLHMGVSENGLYPSDKILRGYASW